MGTDCNAEIEIMRPRRLAGAGWAKINLDRNYDLFDLLSGARSDDASLALFAPRLPEHDAESGETGFTGYTWLFAAEVEAVASAYRSRGARDATELIAIAAAMKALNGSDGERTRCVFQFF